MTLPPFFFLTFASIGCVTLSSLSNIPVFERPEKSAGISTLSPGFLGDARSEYEGLGLFGSARVTLASLDIGGVGLVFAAKAPKSPVFGTVLNLLLFFVSFFFLSFYHFF